MRKVGRRDGREGEGKRGERRGRQRRQWTGEQMEERSLGKKCRRRKGEKGISQ